MKKIGLSVLLALLLTVSGARPASAKLIVDITQILEKVIEYLQKISDSTEKISQQINQIKLSALQGYDLSQLRNLADEFTIPDITVTIKIDKIIKGSKVKKDKVMEYNQELYKHGAVSNFETKKDVASQDYGFLLEQKAIAEGNCLTTAAECDRLYRIYEIEERVWERDKKWGDYVECKTRLDLYCSQARELGVAAGVMLGVVIDNSSKENHARNEDENYKERKKHKETLNEAADRNETNVHGGEEADFAAASAAGAEWDTQGTAEKYKKDSAYYYEFVRRYFYDPTDPNFQGAGFGKEKTVLFQSNLDRLNRERRFLYINTAVHLMQAAGTARREIAKRIGGQDKIAGETAAGPNEYDAMSSYSATRIENMKALLMYAQIQSAKLQYLAAKELLDAELRKDFLKKDRSEFHLIDLNKYLME